MVAQRVRGVEDVRVRLAAAQPGEAVSVFNDALSQLSDQLTYLYRQDRRYWYDTRPNLRRTVEERAQQCSEEEVEAEITRRVREAARGGRGAFRGVHPCPASSADVPDAQETRLVVLSPGATYRNNDTGSDAFEAAADILANRGTAPRQHRNTLVFLAADRVAAEGLREEVRRLLAWGSVVRDQEALNLDTHQRREAAEGEKGCKERVGIKFGEAWRWLLVPTEPVADGDVGDLEWDTREAANGAEILTRASRRVQEAGHLIDRWSPALLRMELDRWFWKERDNVPVKAVWDALTAYCYLPRLCDQAVFVAAIEEGVAGGEYFAYATSVSENERYEGLKLGAPGTTIHVDAASVLVKPDIARTQIASARKEPAAGQVRPAVEPAPFPTSGKPVTDNVLREALPPRRFFGTTALDPDRAVRDMGRVVDEVLQHLTTLPGGKVRVTVEIEAETEDGIAGDVQRVVDENCRTLSFTAHGFERS